MKSKKLWVTVDNYFSDTSYELWATKSKAIANNSSCEYVICETYGRKLGLDKICAAAPGGVGRIKITVEDITK